MGYLEFALRGGYPEPVLGLPESRRHEWMVGYLERVTTRDARDLDVPRDPTLLARYFQAYACNTSGEVADRTVYEAAGISRTTADAYERLLNTLPLVESLPAWSGNRLKRLIRAPKRFVRDSGLAAAALGVDLDDVLRDGNVLGRLIETFVLMQLRAEDCRYRRRPARFHLRQQGGAHEVEVIAELGHRRVIALEIKARSAATPGCSWQSCWVCCASSAPRAGSPRPSNSSPSSSGPPTRQGQPPCWDRRSLSAGRSTRRAGCSPRWPSAYAPARRPPPQPWAPSPQRNTTAAVPACTLTRSSTTPDRSCGQMR